MPRRLEDGLRDLGWVDGRNIQFIWRSAEGDLARLPSLARDLVAQRVDVIVVAGHGVGPAMEATSTIPGMMEQAVRDRVDAVIVGEGLYLHTPEVQATLHALALKHRLPMVHSNLTAVENGGLLAYGPDIADLQRRVAYFVDRILRGAQASDLPIEQPSRFVLWLNLKTATAMGVRIPPSVPLEATRVIR